MAIQYNWCQVLAWKSHVEISSIQTFYLPSVRPTDVSNSRDLREQSEYMETWSGLGTSKQFHMGLLWKGVAED